MIIKSVIDTTFKSDITIDLSFIGLKNIINTEISS